MRHSRFTYLTIALALSTCTFTGSASADLVFGPSARALFESNQARFGDTFIDFENVASGPLTNQLPGLSFRTTFNRFGSHGAVNLPVAVLPWDFVTNSPKRIVGVRTGPPRYIPDGQNIYEINFDEPQKRVGMLRPWNTSSLTRFYSGSTLLAEHQNTTNSEFVGYLADGNDPANWITRVEIDGLTINGVYQSGNTDDIFFGSAVPEPSSFALVSVFGLGLISLRRTRR